MTASGAVAIVGAGAVARSLAPALVAAGFRAVAVVSAVKRDAGRLAIMIGADSSSDSLADIPDNTDAVFVCVPDDAIRSVASQMAALREDWEGVFVAHTSGSLSAAALGPVADRGAVTASFHPLQTFPRDAAPRPFKDCYIGIEGDDAAVAAADRIAVLLDSRPIHIPTSLKPRYHLAASIASNFVTTLLGMVDELFETPSRVGAPDSRIFMPLVHETLKNIDRDAPAAALTGPIARGDAGTLRLHLEALRANREHLLPVYAALATETVRLAVRGQHISPDVAERMLDMVAEALRNE